MGMPEQNIVIEVAKESFSLWKWAAGIGATVISGALVWWITRGKR